VKWQGGVPFKYNGGIMLTAGYEGWTKCKISAYASPKLMRVKNSAGCCIYKEILEYKEAPGNYIGALRSADLVEVVDEKIEKNDEIWYRLVKPHQGWVQEKNLYKIEQTTNESPDGATDQEVSLTTASGAFTNGRKERRRMAQREFSKRRDSPVMTRLLEEIIDAQDD